ncbi:uncharacterized protein LOC125568332 [Nematostella vectensis]|uniref:uncharacterized protein LOC125568332 n=1 Tax=Nematostella vectensis TaxID=45351 RepID=UPI0020770247|nr:uncharacterized protein LOC125568332 [Nematostella vectensis]
MFILLLTLSLLRSIDSKIFDEDSRYVECDKHSLEIMCDGQCTRFYCPILEIKNNKNSFSGYCTCASSLPEDLGDSRRKEEGGEVLPTTQSLTEDFITSSSDIGMSCAQSTTMASILSQTTTPKLCGSTSTFLQQTTTVLASSKTTQFSQETPLIHVTSITPTSVSSDTSIAVTHSPGVMLCKGRNSINDNSWCQAQCESFFHFCYFSRCLCSHPTMQITSTDKDSAICKVNEKGRAEGKDDVYCTGECRLFSRS